MSIPTKWADTTKIPKCSECKKAVAYKIIVDADGTKHYYPTAYISDGTWGWHISCEEG